MSDGLLALVVGGAGFGIGGLRRHRWHRRLDRDMVGVLTVVAS